MAAVAPSADKRTMGVALDAADASRLSALTSATSILPNLDGSFLGLQSQQPTSTVTDKAEPPARLRRVSSEIDHKSRANDASHYDRSGNSSAHVSADEKFASLAHLVSAMNPLGMEARAKTANHDAIVRHFQLRRVSGEASRASYTKDPNDDHDGLERGDSDPSQPVQDPDGSLRTLFAARRLTQTPRLSKHHHDSLRNMNRSKAGWANEIEVARGSLWQRLVFCQRRLWQRARLAARPLAPTGAAASLRCVAVLLVIVVQLFVAPFVPVYGSSDAAILPLAVFIDVVILLDVVVSFHTAYYDEKTGRLEHDRRKVVRRFVSARRKRWLVADALAALPVVVVVCVSTPTPAHPRLSWDSVSPFVVADTASAFVRLLRWKSLLPLTVWGVRTVHEAPHLPLRLTLQRNALAAHAARVVLVFLGAIHYVACLGRVALDEYDHVLDHEVRSMYVDDLSTAVELLFGHLGHRSSQLVPPPSPVFGLVAMTVGALVVAYLTGSAAWLVLRVHANWSRYDAKLAGVLSAMDKMQLPDTLQRRIHEYFDHLWAAHDATDTGEVAAFVRALSPSLALEVNLFKHMDLVLSVPFWRNCSADFVTQIMLSLQVRTYLPEDYVMRQGEIGRDLFLINRGVCELRVRVGFGDGDDLQPYQPRQFVQRTRRMNAGTAFGELALLMNYRRTATVRAVTFVEMCVLERESFQTILTRYRDDRREALREILVSCIERNAQRFVPFPYEPLLAEALHAKGDDPQKPLTSWEAAEVLVDLILAPECVDESVRFGFKDLDSFAPNRLIPVKADDASKQQSTSTPAQRGANSDEILRRLESVEQWQAQTTQQLAGLEHTLASIAHTVARLDGSRNESSSSRSSTM